MKIQGLLFSTTASLLAASLAADSSATDAPLTIKQLIAAVPADAKLKTGSRWQPIGIAVATAALKKSLNKSVELTCKVEVIEPHPYNGHAIVIHSKPVPVTINGTSIPFVVYAYFDSDALEGLGKARVGDTITVSGLLNAAEIQPRGDSQRVFFELVRSRITPIKTR
jgi:hypothetical protein